MIYNEFSQLLLILINQGKLHAIDAYKKHLIVFLQSLKLEKLPHYTQTSQLC